MLHRLRNTALGIYDFPEIEMLENEEVEDNNSTINGTDNQNGTR